MTLSTDPPRSIAGARSALAALAAAGLAIAGEVHASASAGANPAEALFRRMERALLGAETIRAEVVASAPQVRVEGSVLLAGGNRTRLEFAFSGALKLEASLLTCDGETCRGSWLGESGTSDAPPNLGRDLRVFLARAGVCALYPLPFKEVFDASLNRAPLDPDRDPREWLRVTGFAAGPIETIEGRPAQRIDYRLDPYQQPEMTFAVKVWIDLGTAVPLRRVRTLDVPVPFEMVETYRIALDPEVDRQQFVIPGEAERLRPKRLLGHWGAIKALAFSPDGSRLASAGSDHVVRLWDTATWTEVAQLTGQGSGPTDHLSSLAFRPDGAVLASASGDGEIRLWATDSGKVLAILSGHRSAVSALAFAAGGSPLASASFDQTVRIWDPDGKPLRGIETGMYLDAVAWSADGLLVAWSGWGDKGNTRIGASVAATGAEQFRLDGHGWETSALAFDPHGSTLVTPDEAGVVARDPATGAVRLVLAKVEPTSLAFRPDGRILAIGTSGAVLLIDPRTGREVQRLTRIDGIVPALAFSPDGRTVASGSVREIDIWTLGD